MKRLLSVLLLSAVASAIGNGATPTTIPRTRPAGPRPAPDGQRFLFVVEIASAMRANEAANRQALFDLIFTGLDGQMRTGDSFGLWLFNDELHAREFPMQVWEEKSPLDTASLAAKFLRDQKYSGKSRPNVVIPRILNLIKGVRDVNVIILSDGETALEGTPFDANIAAVYQRRKSERSKAQKPFVTALVARGGAIISGAVVIAGEYVEFPPRPLPALAAKGTNNAASPTNAGRVAVAATRAAPTPATVTPAPTAPVEPGEPQTTVTLSLQPVPPPKPKVVQFLTHSNAPPRNPGVEVPAFTNVEAAAPPPVPPPAAPPEPAPGPPPATLVPPLAREAVTAVPETLMRARMPVAAREYSPPIPPDARPLSAPSSGVSAVVTPPSEPGGALLLTIGGVLLTACLGLLAMVIRQPRMSRQVSTITRSMDRR